MFNQEERVAGLMSEVCPFRVGIKTLSGLWFDPNRTSRPVLDTGSCLSTMVVKAGIVTGDTLENLLLLVGFWL